MVFVLRRLLQLVPVLLGISVVTFLVLHLTGDPAEVLLGPDATDALAVAITHAHVRATAKRLGVSSQLAWSRE